MQESKWRFFFDFWKTVTMKKMTKNGQISRDVGCSNFLNRDSESASEITYLCVFSAILDEIDFFKKISTKISIEKSENFKLRPNWLKIHRGMLFRTLVQNLDLKNSYNLRHVRFGHFSSFFSSSRFFKNRKENLTLFPVSILFLF